MNIFTMISQNKGFLSNNDWFDYWFYVYESMNEFHDFVLFRWSPCLKNLQNIRTCYIFLSWSDIRKLVLNMFILLLQNKGFFLIMIGLLIGFIWGHGWISWRFVTRDEWRWFRLLHSVVKTHDTSLCFANISEMQMQQ